MEGFVKQIATALLAAAIAALAARSEARASDEAAAGTGGAMVARPGPCGRRAVEVVQAARPRDRPAPDPLEGSLWNVSRHAGGASRTAVPREARSIRR